MPGSHPADDAARADGVGVAARRRRRLLASAMAVAFAAQLPVWLWVVDDAAISFSYARNLASGDGLVAQPGHERVEGYSNPLWVALLAVGEWMGVSGFVTAKLLGVVFGVLCVPLTWSIARWSRPDRDAWVPGLAAYALATNATFAIWNTSGLENSLFGLLLAAGTWRLLVETGGARFPWSALCFLGVALTRPEGLLYAAVAGTALACFALRDGRGPGPAVRWACVVLLPAAALEGARIAYFAWPLPNTYYAKLATGDALPFDWTGPGWRYLGHWAGLDHADGSPGPGLGQLLLLPLAVLGIAARRRRSGSRALWLCVALAAVTVAFAVATGGDWMNGYRWFSLLAVPAAVLAAAGAGALREWLARAGGAPRAGAAAVAALAVLWVAPQLRHLAWFSRDAPTGAYSVGQRVDYVHELMETLHLEHASVLEVDVGAHLYWSRADVIDLLGLVDVPLAHHRFDPAFLREYLLLERRPDFAHVHGHWAEETAIAQLPGWRRDYVALPGYLGQRQRVHAGDHVRRDLLFARAWSGPAGRRVRFAGGVTLEGWELPGRMSAPGMDLLVGLGITGAGARPVALEVRVENAAGVVARRIALPGHGWLDAADWRPGEVFHGTYRVPLSRRIAPGRYDLVFALRDARGAIVPARPAAGARAWRRDARHPGAARFAGAVPIAAPATLRSHNDADLAALDLRTESGDCDGAERVWASIRARMSGVRPARDAMAAHVGPRLAACWVARAEATARPAAQAALLARARRRDPGAAGLGAAAEPVGRALLAAGDAAREDGDWDAAYRHYADALKADPSLARARRRAEEARRRRLLGG